MTEKEQDPAVKGERFGRAGLLWLIGSLLILALIWPAWSAVTGFLNTRLVMQRVERGGMSGDEAIKQLGGPERALSRLRTYLRMPAWLAPYRRTVPDVLRDLGKPAVDTLIQALSDRDGNVRGEAARALGVIAPDAQGAIQILIRNLQDTHPEARAGAAAALGRFGPAARDALPALIVLLNESGMRHFSIPALLEIGPDRRAVPGLVEALGDETGAYRACAAMALGKIGPEAKEAVPALTRIAAGDPDVGVRQRAAEALGQICPADKGAPGKTGGEGQK